MVADMIVSKAPLCKHIQMKKVFPFYFQVNISNFDIVMESDEGTFMPTGLAFTGSDKARDIMKEIMKLLQPINVTGVFEEGGGTDINYWIRDGIPGEISE